MNSAVLFLIDNPLIIRKMYRILSHKSWLYYDRFGPKDSVRVKSQKYILKNVKITSQNISDNFLIILYLLFRCRQWIRVTDKKDLKIIFKIVHLQRLKSKITLIFLIYI